MTSAYWPAASFPPSLSFHLCLSKWLGDRNMDFHVFNIHVLVDFLTRIDTKNPPLYVPKTHLVICTKPAYEDFSQIFPPGAYKWNKKKKKKPIQLTKRLDYKIIVTGSGWSSSTRRMVMEPGPPAELFSRNTAAMKTKHGAIFKIVWPPHRSRLETLLIPTEYKIRIIQKCTCHGPNTPISTPAIQVGMILSVSRTEMRSGVKIGGISLLRSIMYDLFFSFSLFLLPRQTYLDSRIR